MYTLNHHAYCGMSGIEEEHEDKPDARKEAADRLRAYRQNFHITTLVRGAEWEIQEPEDSVMVPDECGVLALRHVTFECRECGSDCETKEAAAECCAESDDWPDGEASIAFSMRT